MSDFSVHLISTREALSNKLCKNSEQQIVAEDEFIPYTLEDQEKYSGEIHLRPSMHHNDDNDNCNSDLESKNIKEIAENILKDRRQAVEEVGKSVFELQRLVNLTQSIKNNEHLTIEICPALNLSDDPILPASQRIKRMQDAVKKGKELINQGQHQAKLACLQRRKYIKDCESLKSSSWRLVNVPAPMWAETTAKMDKQEVSAGDLIGIDCSFINNKNINKKKNNKKMITQIARKKAALFATAPIVPLFITEDGASPSPTPLPKDKMNEIEKSSEDMLVLLAKVVTNDGDVVASHYLPLDIVRSSNSDDNEMDVDDDNSDNNHSDNSSNGSRINEFLQHRQLHILSSHLLKELLISGAKFADSFTTPVLPKGRIDGSMKSEVMRNLHRRPLKGRLEILALQARTRKEQLTFIISDHLRLIFSLVPQSQMKTNNNVDISDDGHQIEVKRALEKALLQTCWAVLEKWKRQTQPSSTSINRVHNTNKDPNEIDKDEGVDINEDDEDDHDDNNEGTVLTDAALRGDMMIFSRRGADGARGGITRSGQIATIAVLRTHFQIRLMRHLMHTSWVKLGDVLNGSFDTSGYIEDHIDFIDIFWQTTSVPNSSSSKILVGKVRLDGTFGKYELWQSKEVVSCSMHLSTIVTSLLFYLAGSFMSAAGAKPLLGGSRNCRNSAALWNFQGQTLGLAINLPESLNLHPSTSSDYNPKNTFSIRIRSEEKKEKEIKQEKIEKGKKGNPLISIQKPVKWTDTSLHTFLASNTNNPDLRDINKYPYDLGNFFG